MHAHETVHIVPSFHYDVAYLQTCEAYIPRTFEILDEALRILAADPDYRFTIEQVYLLERYWSERPEQRESLRRFVAAGRIEFAPGAYVLADVNMPSGEALCQQMRIGRAWLHDTFGVEPTVYYNPDDWGHPPQLPQMLAQCGYTAYLFWRCMRRDVAMADFLWAGLDGTRLPTHWFARGYSGLTFPDSSERLNALELAFTESGVRQMQTLVGQLRQHGEGGDWLVMNGGDFRRPQASAPAALRQLDAALAQQPPGPPSLRLRFSSLAAFMAAQSGATRPVVGGEFNSALQGTFTTNIRLKQQDRLLTHRLLALERLAVALDAPLKSDALWKPILKQEFHDILCGTLCDDALADSLREFRAAGRAIDRAFARLARPGRAETGRVPAFFNPLPFARTEHVDVDGIPAAITLPPLGFAAAAAALPLPAAAPATLPLTFATPFYTAVIGADGYLQSLRVAGVDRELVRRQPCAFGTIAMQMDYGDLWLNFAGPLSGGSLESALTQNQPDPFCRTPPDAIVQGTVEPRVTAARAVRRGDDELVIEQELVLSYWRIHLPLRTTMVLSRHTPAITFRTHLTPTGKHYRLRAVFPSTLVGGTIRHEVAFGVTTRDEAEHAAQTWIDYADAAGGLALINTGNPANGVHDGNLMLTLFRAAAMEYKAPSVLSFAEGVPHTFDYAILPHGAAADGAILQAAHAINLPPVATAVPVSRMGETWRVSAATVVLSALRREGRDVFVRLYESGGQPTTVVFHAPARFASWAPADGLQHPTAAFTPISAHGLALTFRPFEIRCVLLRRG